MCYCFFEELGLELFWLSFMVIIVVLNGDVYLVNGYVSYYIFRFDKDGWYLIYFGN